MQMDDFEILKNKLLNFRYLDLEEFKKDIEEMELVYGNTEVFCDSEAFFHIKETYEFKLSRSSLHATDDNSLITIIKSDLANNNWNETTQAAFSILLERYPDSKIEELIQ
jgi:hypothetical protein